MVFLLLVAGCAPVPGSIAFEGGNEPVVVHTRDGVPVKRAVLLDKEGVAFDPQPYLTWSVDHPDVVTLKNGALYPNSNGIARIWVNFGDLASNGYTVEVRLNEADQAKKDPVLVNVCSVADYGNGVLKFTCDDQNFPRGLSTYLAEHGTPTVTAVSPLVRSGSEGTNDVPERALVTSYLVVTQPL